MAGQEAPACRDAKVDAYRTVLQALRGEGVSFSGNLAHVANVVTVLAAGWAAEIVTVLRRDGAGEAEAKARAASAVECLLLAAMDPEPVAAAGGAAG